MREIAFANWENHKPQYAVIMNEGKDHQIQPKAKAIKQQVATPFIYDARRLTRSEKLLHIKLVANVQFNWFVICITAISLIFGYAPLTFILPVIISLAIIWLSIALLINQHTDIIINNNNLDPNSVRLFQ